MVGVSMADNHAKQRVVVALRETNNPWQGQLVGRYCLEREAKVDHQACAVTLEFDTATADRGRPHHESLARIAGHESARRVCDLRSYGRRGAARPKARDLAFILD